MSQYVQRAAEKFLVQQKGNDLFNFLFNIFIIFFEKVEET